MSLLVKIPVATSLSRATSFNKANVGKSFSNYEKNVKKKCIATYAKRGTLVTRVGCVNHTVRTELS